ncbi:MAG TPA: hypothetical protein VFJ85_08930 [Acidimicrobiales bacterium]|nr:hypothetical protein [Acidimicrobiales bacterium]
MTEGSRLRHPNWALALSILDKFVPGSSGFDPDEIVGLTPESWTPIEPAEGSDAVIAEWLWSTFGPVEAGFVVAVTFASHVPEVGPFFLDSAGLRDLVKTHAERFDDPFFSGDAAILDVDNGRLLVVHHDCMAAELRREPTSSEDTLR